MRMLMKWMKCGVCEGDERRSLLSPLKEIQISVIIVPKVPKIASGEGIGYIRQLTKT